MKKDIIINGIDRTGITAGHGYSVTYIKVHGGNGGTMLTGKEVEDVLAKKARISMPLFPTSLEDAEDLIADIYANDYATVYFYDLKSNAYKTSECIYEEIEAKPLLQSIDGHDYWYCGRLMFTERE